MKLFLFFILVLAFNQLNAQTIRLLTWWDYLAPNVVERVQKSGFKLEISPYKSNEVAFAKLISKSNEYDAAIVSGTILDSVSKIVEFEGVQRINSSRKYLDFIPTANCVPYMWSVTLFSVKGSAKIYSLPDLLSLKNKGYSVAVIDDALEIAARSMLDGDCVHGNDSKKMSWDSSKKCMADFGFLNGLSAADLKTSTAEYLIKKNSAAYGWHGEITSLLDGGADSINVFLPERSPVIGVDYLCAFKKSKIDKRRLVEFIKLLTDRQSIKSNVEMTGYFSPYMNHKVKLHSKIKTVLNEIFARKKYKPLLLNAPPKEVHDSLNTRWQKVKYEEKSYQ
ncbi:MAG: hypothetical protein H7Z71_05305 [Moraxellaceae bacterium]|nr:hypothetical protein [Pseudobdellovibrionaceae bacterium]